MGMLVPTASTLSEAVRAAGGSPEELYRTCGRVAGLAIANRCQLGLPLALSFVRLLAGEEPSSVAELQAALREDSGVAFDFRAARTLLDTPLADQGLAGFLTLTRQISHAPAGTPQVELKPGAAISPHLSMPRPRGPTASKLVRPLPPLTVSTCAGISLLSRCRRRGDRRHRRKQG